MNDYRILELVKRALDKLLVHDNWLLSQNLNEPCISHRIAMYLTDRFNGYDVDCEYNGNCEDESRRKRISYIEDQLLEERNRVENEIVDDEEIRVVNVYPDIIIHKRKFNHENLCVIEVKKSTNRRYNDFDRIKLKAYTSSSFGNNLHYQLGMFIIVHTGIEIPSYTCELYKNGEILNENDVHMP